MTMATGSWQRLKYGDDRGMRIKSSAGVVVGYVVMPVTVNESLKAFL
jgi:hypothetical protein